MKIIPEKNGGVNVKAAVLLDAAGDAVAGATANAHFAKVVLVV